MSKINITPNASGTGTLTIASQNTNSDYTLTLPNETGTFLTSASNYNITTKGLWENANAITANYTIGSNNNAMSAGVVTVNAGVTVTVPAGSRWVIV
jgi:hypothetical protein